MACCRIPIRFLTTLCVCLIAFSLSDNIYTTIVSMVQQPAVWDQSTALCLKPGPRHASHQLTGRHGDRNNHSKHYVLHRMLLRDEMAAKYSWSAGMQGVIMGSYYWSSLLVLVPFGHMADRKCCTMLLNSGLLLSGVLFLLVPHAAQASVWLLVGVRVLMGMSQAAAASASFVMVCRWHPLQERSVALALVGNVATLSSVLFLFSTPFIIKSFTWEGMFYIPGVLSLLIFVTVAPFLRNDPSSHPLMRQDELDCIKGNSLTDETRLIDDDSNMITSESQCVEAVEAIVPQRDCGTPVPWMSMLSNPSVLAVILWKLAYAMLTTVLASESPSFFANVHGMSVADISQLTACANILYLSGCLIAAKASEELISRGLVERTKCRKIFSLIAGSVTAAAALIMPLSRCSQQVAVAMFLLSYASQSFYVAVDLTLPSEMTTRFTGVLFAVCNIASMTPGFIGPMYSGAVLQLVTEPWLAWDIIFSSCCGLVFVANIIFIAFASAEKQPFDKLGSETDGERGFPHLVTS